MFGIHQYFIDLFYNFCFQAAQLGDLVNEIATMSDAVAAYKNEFMLIALLLYCLYNYLLIFIFYRAVVFFWNLLINRR